MTGKSGELIFAKMPIRLMLMNHGRVARKVFIDRLDKPLLALLEIVKSVRHIGKRMNTDFPGLRITEIIIPLKFVTHLGMQAVDDSRTFKLIVEEHLPANGRPDGKEQSREHGPREPPLIGLGATLFDEKRQDRFY